MWSFYKGNTSLLEPRMTAFYLHHLLLVNLPLYSTAIIDSEVPERDLLNVLRPPSCGRKRDVQPMSVELVVRHRL